MSIEQEKMIVEALPSLYPLQEFEEKAIQTILDALPSAELGTNLAEVGTDCISRQAAIDAIRRLYIENPQIDNDFAYDMALDQADDAIKQLPPIQPQRGRWILDRSGAYCCSECMEPCATYVMMRPRDKFCKMCGSRNEVTE